MLQIVRGVLTFNLSEHLATMKIRVDTWKLASRQRYSTLNWCGSCGHTEVVASRCLTDFVSTTVPINARVSDQSKGQADDPPGRKWFQKRG